MKTYFFLILIITSFISCSGPAEEKPDASFNPEQFEKKYWTVKEGKDYPHRREMLKDIMDSMKLHGLTRNEVVNLLGSPDRTDSGYLYYMVDQKRLGFWPIGTQTLVIKLGEDSLVEWRKVHGTGWN